jgi:1-acyl-sn-glycerol-3-phosphate acyltransferase
VHTSIEKPEMTEPVERDPGAVAAVLWFLRLAMRTYFRSEVHGMEKVPDGGALLVGNHSGGLLAMDVPIIAVAFSDAFGVDRPLYCLAHDLLFTGSGDSLFRRYGFIPAQRENALRVLRDGAATIVFPGGDYDVFRPTRQGSVIDFNGRTGYVRTALEAGVPIVPVVSLGGQEAQLHLSRGQVLGRLSPFRKLMRTDLFPLSVGFPFGLTAAFPPNLPLPTKIVTEVLDPIDPATVLGGRIKHPDRYVDRIDQLVRDRMQDALSELARRRRFPVLG